MNRRIRGLEFWCRNAVENLALILLASLVLMAFMAMKVSPAPEQGYVQAALSMFTFYPYYMFVTGGFLMLIGVSAYTYTYIPLMVSFSCKRPIAVLGIMSSMAGTILGMLALSALVCALVPGGQEQWGTLPLLAGAVFLETGIGVIIGSAGLKWGRAGKIAMGLLMAVSGGVFGSGLAAGEVNLAEQALRLYLNPFVVLAAGIAAFAASGIFAAAVSSKLEVRL